MRYIYIYISILVWHVSLRFGIGKVSIISKQSVANNYLLCTCGVDYESIEETFLSSVGSSIAESPVKLTRSSLEICIGSIEPYGVWELFVMAFVLILFYTSSMVSDLNFTFLIEVWTRIRTWIDFTRTKMNEMTLRVKKESYNRCCFCIDRFCKVDSSSNLTDQKEQLDAPSTNDLHYGTNLRVKSNTSIGIWRTKKWHTFLIHRVYSINNLGWEK